MLKQAKDLLSFKAFKPSKFDVNIPLAERFYQEGPIMGISLSKYSVTCAAIEFIKRTEVAVSKIRTFSINCDALEEMAVNDEKIQTIALFAKENGLPHVLVLSSPGMQVIKLNRPVNTKVNSLTDGIAAALGEQPEEDRAYAYVSNPKCDESLIFSYDQGKIDQVVSLLRSSGLEVVRAGCSIYGVFDYLMNEKPESLFLEQMLLIYSSDSLIIASICENRLQQIGFRTNIENLDMESYLPRMIERFECKHTQVSYINCSDWDIQTYFSLNYPSIKVVPIFENSFEGIFQAASHG